MRGDGRMELIIMNYFSFPLNRELSKTHFAKALLFFAVAVYFPSRPGVAQPGSAPVATDLKTMT